MKPLVIICGVLPSTAEKRLSQEANVKRISIDRNELTLSLRDADGLILRNMPYVDSEILNQALKLKVKVVSALGLTMLIWMLQGRGRSELFTHLAPTLMPLQNILLPFCLR
ncbi:MAG: hypothetical protein ACUVRR_13595 [Candidatus Fervidibacter sp.]|uniref:hypothetical protein n=1 Tax=Candidatus Fervidibacter sp. TaxID=3100871 RepID=UPI0040494A10